MTTISSFMSADHDRLDALMAQARAADDPPGAADSFAEFTTGLLTHIEWEEGILFPVFEERTGMSDAGPTAVMRMEHEQIRRLLDAGRVPSGRDEFARIAVELASLLAMHNRKEELILYPWMDRELTADQIAQAFQRMRAS